VQAVLAAHDMAAESHRAAALDRRHHLQLAETDVASIGFTPSRPVVRKMSATSRIGRAISAARQAGGSSFLPMR
jgi:hypothetical protein